MSAMVVSTPKASSLNDITSLFSRQMVVLIEKNMSNVFLIYNTIYMVCSDINCFESNPLLIK